MKHATPTPGARRVGVPFWLSVAALGLVIGALGVGGLAHLLGYGLGPVASVASATKDRVSGDPGHRTVGPAAGSHGSTSSGSASAAPWQAAKVVAPSQVPDGAPLAGSAPAARTAKDGVYTPFVPTTLRLPSGRKATILPEGVRSDGSLEIPSDPDQVGWWNGGAQAGEPYGGTVLAGHVDSASFGLGVMAELRTMRAGQVLRLTAGSHAQNYRVASVRTLLKTRLTAHTDLFDQQVRNRLVMITCGGPFDTTKHSYRDNVVLIATPIT